MTTGIRLLSLIFIIALASGCDINPEDRAIIGAGAGAASGAVIGAIDWPGIFVRISMHRLLLLTNNA